MVQKARDSRPAPWRGTKFSEAAIVDGDQHDLPAWWVVAQLDAREFHRVFKRVAEMEKRRGKPDQKRREQRFQRE